MKSVTKFAAVTAASLVSLLTSVNASVIISGTFDGNYTTATSNSVAFTPVAGNLYGVSAALNISTFPFVENDQTANFTWLAFNGSPNYGNGQSWYTFSGEAQRFVNTFGGASNQLLGPAATGPIYTGFSLDTTAPLWSVSYYYGGTGFDANSVYQGATAYGTVANITPFSITQILFSYDPIFATGGDASGIVSDFKVTAVPEPSTWLLLVGSLTALVVRRRRSMV